jgi:hypothetical protein
MVLDPLEAKSARHEGPKALAALILRSRSGGNGVSKLQRTQEASFEMPRSAAPQDEG